MHPQPAHDRALLQQYAATGDQAAFASVVRRHLDLVYSAAIRQVRDNQLAEDAAQIVFALLARRAGELEPGVIVPGWLVQTTRFVCLDLLRTRTSQNRVEQHAARLKPMITSPPDNFAVDQSAVSSQLDDALSELGGIDRDAIVLRYFCNENAAQIGAALGLSEAAAAKRLVRAVRRLRGLMNRRSPRPLSAPMLATMLARAVGSAPTGLAERAAVLSADAIKHAATLARSMPASVSTSKGVLLMAAASKTQIAIAAAVLIAMATGSAVVYHSIARRPADRLVVIPPKQRAPATIDLRTPQSALHSVFSAVNAADAAALQRCLYASNPNEESLNKAWAAVTIATVRLNDAMELHFGDAGLRMNNRMLWPSAEPTPPADARFTVQTQPGAALVGTDTAGWGRVVNVNGEWKFDIVTLYPHDQFPLMTSVLSAAADRMNYLRTQVESGQIKTLAQAQSQRMTCGDGRILVNRAAFDPQPATSQPGLGAGAAPLPAEPSARAVSPAR